ncbi:MAG: peptide chain release factor N(5)-glutamine methyltransferase [Chitinophagaceae bacterium]|nr:peptide chain release factor N(5)-glutamine methyltransferase [Chitinophagaceae bacterium]
MTYRNVYDHYIKIITPLYDLQEAESITSWIFEDKLGLSKIQLLLRGNEVISEVKANELAYALVRLSKGEPIQYVLGYTNFYGLKIKVNRHVLIPRPETEELVAWIVQEQLHRQPCNMLDVGTGSGCIAIALKTKLPQATVTAIDISEKALLIAETNATFHQAAINLQKADVLGYSSKPAPLDTFGSNISPVFVNKFDIIVSNPPYIPISEVTTMHRNVTAYEPHLALFVPDHEPLVYYHAIAKLASQCLLPDGLIYLELHQNHASQVADLLNSFGFSNIKINNDLQGKLRMLKAGR